MYIVETKYVALMPEVKYDFKWDAANNDKVFGPKITHKKFKHNVLKYPLVDRGSAKNEENEY